MELEKKKSRSSKLGGHREGTQSVYESQRDVTLLAPRRNCIRAEGCSCLSQEKEEDR